MSRIKEYSFGHIVIDGEEHTKDVIILPDRVVSNWWRKDGHSLVMEDLESIVPDLGKHLVIGSGAYGRMKPDPRTIEQLEDRGIAVEILPTPDAARRYGELDRATTVAALHLTC
ncbi:MAG: Mth938-like domain-containing protein [Actinomycetota bacterium]